MPDLAAIRAYCEAATEGDWVPSISGTVLWSGAVAVFETLTMDGLSREQRQANIEFAAHARTDLPAVVEALEEARTLMKAARKNHVCNCPDCAAIDAFDAAITKEAP